MTLAPRPIELKIALLLAFLGMSVDLGFIIANRLVLGHGWIALFSAKGFVSIFYLFFFTLAYNGRAWVRFVYAVLFVLGIVRFAREDIALILNPWLVSSAILSLTAIALWFFPNTNEWYRSVRYTMAAPMGRT